jgi:hypothetical protein
MTRAQIVCIPSQQQQDQPAQDAGVWGRVSRRVAHGARYTRDAGHAPGSKPRSADADNAAARVGVGLRDGPTARTAAAGMEKVLVINGAMLKARCISPMAKCGHKSREKTFAVVQSLHEWQCQTAS